MSIPGHSEISSRDPSTLATHKLSLLLMPGLQVHKTCVPMLRLLLELGADPNVKLTSRGDLTPLHYMIQKGSVEGARLLLENGADPNAQMSGHAQGSTAFHIVKE
jgi:ankyrin repeat protein